MSIDDELGEESVEDLSISDETAENAAGGKPLGGGAGYSGGLPGQTTCGTGCSVKDHPTCA